MEFLKRNGVFLVVVIVIFVCGIYGAAVLLDAVVTTMQNRN